jgi:hypothetical protein
MVCKKDWWLLWVKSGPGGLEIQQSPASIWCKKKKSVIQSASLPCLVFVGPKQLEQEKLIFYLYFRIKYIII